MTDTMTVRIIAVALAVLAALGMGLSAWLLYAGKTTEAVVVLSTPTSTAIGALAALLASTKTRGDQPAT